jgi:hypothetical protein
VPGPQFIHLQTFARKANSGGQSVAQVLAEASRAPEFSAHVSVPRPVRIVFGVSPAEVQTLHDEMVAAGGVSVNLKDGTTARRGVRQDRHTLLTCVASHPHLTEQVLNDPDFRADYDGGVDRNLRFLRGLFGNRLVSVVEHTDEDHPHLHAYILPLDDAGCSARDLNPCWSVKTEAEERARAAGHDDKAAVKFGNLAYRARARELQDQYHLEVGLPSGLTRTGPSRERLSRQQWRARKDEAVRAARLLHQVDAMAGELMTREDALNQSVEQQAVELVAKLEEAEAIYAAAEGERVLMEAERLRLADIVSAQERQAAAIRAAAEEEAAKIKDAAKTVAAQTVRTADAELACARQQASEMTQSLQNAQLAFEGRKATLVQHAVKEAAAVVVRVIASVLSGDVTVKPDQSGWLIRDADLQKRVQALDLGLTLFAIVTAVSEVWERLRSRLSAADLAQERQQAADMAAKVDLPPATNLRGFDL